MLSGLSRWSGYLALAFLGAAVAIFLFVFLNLRADELLANLIFWSLVASFCCFVFWAVSATWLAIRRNHQAK